jgi:hypothetical protein
MDHLDISNNTYNMEMNFISKADVNYIIGSSNCIIEAIHETDKCGPNIKNCIYVIKKN